MVSTQIASSHKLSIWPHFWKSRERVSCLACTSSVQRKAYERGSKWRTRQTKFMNKHSPFMIDLDGRGQDWEAR